YEPIKGFRFACRNKKEESYNRQQTDTLFKKRKMSALRFAESIMRLPCTIIDNSILLFYDIIL
ncbi:MAG: hypothetical protein MSH22_11080, partial [Spirochaetia bacterium]|nr:hypothetical protein [Spirochaetia bacterium]